MIDDPWADQKTNYNTNNFNNIITAIIAIFEALTLEGWSHQMHILIESGNGVLAISFYLLLVTFGSYFILNLILAVIMDAFDDVDNNSRNEDEKKEKEKAAKSVKKDD